MLYNARCTCGRLLGRINGYYEIKCPRCKAIKSGVLLTPSTKEK
jgi:phage FluMu protein Com